MAALVLDGRSLARSLETALARRAAAVTAVAGGRAPRLAVILAGADRAAESHARLKVAAGIRAGIEVQIRAFPARASTAEVTAEIDRLNGDATVHGIFLQYPVAGAAQARRCFDRISLAKDVGGDTAAGIGWWAVGDGGGAFPSVRPFPSATPAAILRLLAHHGIELAGRQAVVAGCNTHLARPMALLLMGADATVTLVDPRAAGLRDVLRRAHLVVGAAGMPHCVPGDWLPDGAVVVDTGYGVADIDLSGATARCAAYTPVPGGVGPVTISALLAHTVEAAERAVTEPATLAGTGR